MYLCGVDETSRLAGTTSGVPGPGIQGATKKGLRNSGGLRCISAGSTRLELATSGVTGRCSNQLNYDPICLLLTLLALVLRFLFPVQYRHRDYHQVRDE